MSPVRENLLALCRGCPRSDQRHQSVGGLVAHSRRRTPVFEALPRPEVLTELGWSCCECYDDDTCSPPLRDRPDRLRRGARRLRASTKSRAVPRPRRHQADPATNGCPSATPPTTVPGVPLMPFFVTWKALPPRDCRFHAREESRLECCSARVAAGARRRLPAAAMDERQASTRRARSAPQLPFPVPQGPPARPSIFDPRPCRPRCQRSLQLDRNGLAFLRGAPGTSSVAALDSARARGGSSQPETAA
jgi:hypothetical protein